MIPYGRQDITDEDIRAVTEALKSDFITQGPFIEKFEKRVAEYCGVKYAVAVNSCTAALHLAYMALGINEGKTVWTVPNTFVATANAALYCGGGVDFVDIDPNTYLMCPKALEAKLAGTDKKPDLVAPVHFSGQSCEMDKIHALSKEYGFKVVEDAAHCIGAGYKDKKIGCCDYSDIAVFSFHPVKIITTGEGGMITTNDKDLYDTLIMARTHGITKNPELMNIKDKPGWYFEQHFLGYHYRITDLQCALGYSQMDRLNDYIDKRRQLVKRYNDQLSDLPLKLPVTHKDAHSSWHLYVVGIDKSKTGISRDEVFNLMRDKDIGVNMHYIPVHLHPYYKAMGFKEGQFPVSEKYYNEALTLPLYPTLKEEEQDYVCERLKAILHA